MTSMLSKRREILQLCNKLLDWPSNRGMHLINAQLCIQKMVIKKLSEFFLNAPHILL
jgi:hypothetical protein